MSINRLRPTQKPISGFTIVEMLIIAPIVILVIGTFISAVVNMTGEILMTRGANALAYSIQDALNRIEADIKLSTTFLSTNNITPTLPQGYNDNTSNFTNVGANGNMLILNTLATTGNPLSSTNGLVYLKDTPNSCTGTQYNQNTPMTMNVIYFVKNNTLWRRTIVPANYLDPAVACATPWQQASCTPTIVSSFAFCKAQDVRLVDNVDIEDFVVQYFNSASATTADSVASSTSQTEDQRYAALQSDTTVVASLNVSKTIAGRDINQSGAIRSTRLDVNASTIAPIVPDVVPAAPTVAGSINPATPTTVDFTWNSVPGATTYTLNYTLDGGGANQWVSGFANDPRRDFSIQGEHGKIVCAGVYANGPGGTSPLGSMCITIPIWAPIILQNNWSDYGGGYATSAYAKTSDNIVILKGLIKVGSTPPADVIVGILPVGYRPSEQLIFQTSWNNAASRVDVYTNGEIRLVSATSTNGWVTLDGINFMASTSTSPFLPMTPLLNGWLFYGAPWATPAYLKDGEGRVHTKGLVYGGTFANGTPITNLPAGYRPAEYLHLPDDVNSIFGFIGIATNGDIQSRGGFGNSYQSLQSMYYPADYSGWSNLSLQNSWVQYDAAYALPQYTKGSDGIVIVKGLVKSGAADTVVATLPVGYRPAGTLLTGSVCYPGSFCRVDIAANGNIVVRTGASSSWSSLTEIVFMAEQ